MTAATIKVNYGSLRITSIGDLAVDTNAAAWCCYIGVRRS